MEKNPLKEQEKRQRKRAESQFKPMLRLYQHFKFLADPFATPVFRCSYSLAIHSIKLHGVRRQLSAAAEANFTPSSAALFYSACTTAQEFGSTLLKHVILHLGSQPFYLSLVFPLFLSSSQCVHGFLKTAGNTPFRSTYVVALIAQNRPINPPPSRELQAGRALMP